MKKYLSVLAASLFILSAAGCAASGVNGGFSGADTDYAPAADAVLGSAEGSSAGGTAVHGTPAGGISAAATTGGRADTAAAGTAGGTGSGTSAETGGSSASSAETGVSAGASADDGGTSSGTVKDPAAEVTVDSDRDTSTKKDAGEYAPVDIGGIGSEAFTDDIAATDIAFEDAGIAEDVAFDEDMDVIDDYVGDDFLVDPWYEREYIQPSAGLLTGGEWRDNDHWSDWKALYSTHSDWEMYRREWRVNYENRAAVSVTAGGAPVEGARVTCANGTSAVTDNKGRAYIFYETDSGAITVEYNGETKTADSVSGDGAAEIALDGTAQDFNKLDLMIMCDTTGSMYDELSYLQVELSDIVEKIQGSNANTDLMLSVNFYRDEGDEYVVREYPFTDDISAAVTAIGQQRADGGGDYPEAVHTALDSAINNHDWDEDAVKIMFLVLDAPPHSEDIQVVDSVRRYVEQAAENGIRIIPIASSGVDKSTEYLLRTMSFVTGGTYTFLTDDSGVGGGHIEPTVGAYNVEKLNDMMVRIVNGYLS